MTNIKFFVNAIYRKKSFIDMARFSVSKDLIEGWYSFYFWYPLILGMLVMYLSGREEVNMIDFIISYTACSVFYLIKLKFIEKRTVKENCEHTKTFRFFEDRFEVVWANGGKAIRYSELCNIYERKNYFYLEKVNGNLYMIPKDNFQCGNINEFKTFIKVKIFYSNEEVMKKRIRKVETKKDKRIYVGILIGIIVGNYIIGVYSIEKKLDKIIGRKPAVHYEIYKDALYKLPKSDEEYSKIMDEGKYVVGRDIQEGIYSIYLIEGEVNIDMKSKEHKIEIRRSLRNNDTKYISELHNVHLYNGQNIEISNSTIKNDSKIRLVTSN